MKAYEAEHTKLFSCHQGRKRSLNGMNKKILAIKEMTVI